MGIHINIRTKKSRTIHRGSAVLHTYQLNIVIDKDVSSLVIIIKEIDGWWLCQERARK